MHLYRFIVTGRVQGVYYRKSVSQNAMLAGYRGSVQNLSDGSVEVYAELLASELDGFLALLKQGSPLSEVINISYQIEDDKALEYDGFVVVT